MIGLVIPTKSNNHTPHLLSKTAMLVYILFIFTLNFLLPQLGIFNVKADITTHQLLDQHNEIRTKNGLEPLRLNNKLVNSATYKSLAMMEADCWSHYCPDGKSPWEFFEQAEYTYVNAGENLAEGFVDVNSVMNAWMNSETHKENILNSNFNEIGFGFAYGHYQGKEDNVIVTVHFGKMFEPTVAATDISVSEAAKSIVISKIENVGKGEKNTIQVTGNVNPENSSVKINVNNSEVGRVLATGSNYTYRSKAELIDGSYKVNAELLDFENKAIALSVDEHIVLDNNKPEIVGNKIDLEIKGGLATISFLASQDTLLVSSDIESESKERLMEGSFVLKYSKASIENHESSHLTITLIDKSGNESVYKVKVKTILDKFTSTNLESEQFTVENVNYKNSNTRVLLIIGIIAYLAILMFIDFLVLSKKQMLSAVNRKSHLQFAVLIILIIVLNVSGFGGTILNGTAI